MTRGWLIFAAFASAALSAGVPATAQVRVVVDGQVQEVPHGVVRVISWQPGGYQQVHDEPFQGHAMPGSATVTNTETTVGDGAWPARTMIVTRIVPTPASAAPRRMWRSADLPPPAPARAQPSYQAAEPERISFPDTENATPGTVRIRRDPATGHFITTVRVNGVPIRAIVDTGAANTILSPSDAHATGADGEIVDTQRMIGIGGYTMLNVARVRSLEVAGQNLGTFSTPVGQQGLGYSLLGQSEIARLGRIVIEDGTMTITPRRIQMSSR
jgi:clan AA aspartic protease (TIGR02281 family)